MTTGGEDEMAANGGGQVTMAAGMTTGGEDEMAANGGGQITIAVVLLPA